ncbi:MAG TPA: electron transport complex subunit RsxC [Caldithrix abyssi]|uniref:Ion-translocating oxidoreductase complex subunit C n=1 Tax=Caldithrix abyssi TaxID=187145 RepID=A0A7V1LK01_CALAY|nr:electron transport complex subunit RsxC [Caldithrix abyssi]
MLFDLLKKNPTFRHGIHPPQFKEDTRDKPIRHFPFAPVMIIPLAQHIGKPSVPVVSEGQEVTRGQLLARADGFVSVPMHAPASGVIKKIGRVPSISGKMVPGIFLEPFPGSSQEVLEGKPVKVETSTPEEIINAIQNAGIVGLGGAAFPTHVKLKIPEGKHADTLIINGAECEPYLTTDHRVMLEQAPDIIQGVRYLLKATGAARAIIGIESNKPDAAENLRNHLPPDLPLSVQVVEVKYPQGAEKMLITAILGREVPSGGLPIDVHTVVVNVATTAEIGRLLPHGRGIQERVITITGPGIKKKGNYWIPIGTPLRYILEQAGAEEDIDRVFMGGPMMGTAVSSLDIPITKGTSGIVAFREEEARKKDVKIYPCIHCGACVDACPLFLNPSKLGILAKFKDYHTMASDYNLMDCFECGSCTYVCPSHIPLVQYFRISKLVLRNEKAKAPHV